MDAAAAEALARRYVEEVWNQGNLALVEEFVSPAFAVRHPAGPGPLHGPAGLVRIVHLFRMTHPDLRLVIAELVVRGDRVEMRMTLHATHSGAVPGDGHGTGAPASRLRQWRT